MSSILTGPVSTWVGKVAEKLQDPTLPYPRAVIGLVGTAYVFELFVNLRQYFKLTGTEPPESIKPYAHLLSGSKSSSNEDDGDKPSKDPQQVIQETFLKSQAYARDRLVFSTFKDFIDIIKTGLMLTGVLKSFFAPDAPLPWTGIHGLWDLSAKLAGPALVTGEISHSLAFLGLVVAAESILSIPFSLYETFVIEERHGFNKTTLKTFCLDFVKSLGLSAVLGAPIVSALIWVTRWAGASFVQYVSMFIIGLQLVMIPIFPYIQRLFNSFKYLSSFKDKPNYLEAQERIENLAKKLNFPLGELYVIDGSKRSALSNAYFYGLPYLSKQIVLYDTLLDKTPPDEVEAVLAHELGHWKLNHVFEMIVCAQFSIVLTLSLFSVFLFNPALYSSFGFSPDGTPWSMPIVIGFQLCGGLVSPLDTLSNFVMNGLSRKREFQADKFAKDLDDSYAEKLRMALVRLTEENASLTDIDWLYSAFRRSHPTLSERFEALSEDEKKEN